MHFHSSSYRVCLNMHGHAQKLQAVTSSASVRASGHTAIVVTFQRRRARSSGSAGFPVFRLTPLCTCHVRWKASLGERTCAITRGSDSRHLRQGSVCSMACSVRRTNATGAPPIAAPCSTAHNGGPHTLGSMRTTFFLCVSDVRPPGAASNL